MARATTEAAETVGQVISRICDGYHKTQRGLARSVGRNHKTIQRYIAGEMRMPSALAQKAANYLFDDPEEKRYFISTCLNEEQETVRLGAIRSRRKKALSKIKEKYYATVDSMPVTSNQKRMSFLAMISTIYIFPKGAWLPPEKDIPFEEEVISFCGLNGFNTPLGDIENYNEQMSFDNKVRRYLAYCKENRMPHEGLIELAFSEAMVSPWLNPDTYQKNRFCLVKENDLQHWAKLTQDVIDRLTQKENTEYGEELDIGWLRMHAASLDFLNKQAEEIRVMRDSILNEIHKVYEAMNRLS